MIGGNVDSYEIMKRRYEQLKKLYFSPQSSSYGDDEEGPSAMMNRTQIVQMFENMGVELPLTPNDEMKFRRR